MATRAEVNADLTVKEAELATLRADRAKSRQAWLDADAKEHQVQFAKLALLRPDLSAAAQTEEARKALAGEGKYDYTSVRSVEGMPEHLV